MEEVATLQVEAALIWTVEGPGGGWAGVFGLSLEEDYREFGAGDWDVGGSVVQEGGEKDDDVDGDRDKEEEVEDAMVD